MISFQSKWQTHLKDFWMKISRHEIISDPPTSCSEPFQFPSVKSLFLSQIRFFVTIFTYWRYNIVTKANKIFDMYSVFYYDLMQFQCVLKNHQFLPGKLLDAICKILGAKNFVSNSLPNFQHNFQTIRVASQMTVVKYQNNRYPKWPLLGKKYGKLNTSVLFRIICTVNMSVIC